ncbi:MAG: MerR family transcriptional regulator [Chitinophagaceae bacterium]|nr:MerR family transcriptional regulator [Chitinophagaceae bacterium]
MDVKQSRKYTVKEISALAGVTVRTLHLYDRIGLLKPSYRTEKRYRLYGEKELLRLQQILFYKELGLPLAEITDILEDPDFDLVKALEGHRKALESRKERITEMLATIDKTILNLKGKMNMTHEELYAGLPKEKATAWQKFAREKWPLQMKHSEQTLLKMSKEQFSKLQEGFKANIVALATLLHYAPESPEVQNEIAVHYQYIQQFWGRPENIGEAYKGLGQLYVDEPLYTTVNGVANPDFAVFMKAAMDYYVDTNL